MKVNPMLDERLEKIVRDLFMGGDTEAQISPDANFVESGLCDSLGLVRLATALEAEFPGIRIHDQEINRATLGSLDLLNAFMQSKLEEL
jgi:acyl carrier protein